MRRFNRQASGIRRSFHLRRAEGPLRLILLWCVCVLLCNACAPPAENTLRFGLASAPANLDPRYATDATSTRINRLLYAQLVDFDEQARPVASLAHWERLDPRHYRFHLGTHGRRFHDGSRLTAHDVAATYRSILDPATASPHRGVLKLIERIAVLDDDTLDFHLAHADPVFPGYLAIGILPAARIAAGHPFQDAPLGSGPFRFESWPEPWRLRLVRVRDGQRVEFLRIGDPTVRVLKLMRGEIDLLQNDLPAELVAYLEHQKAVIVTRRAGSNFSYLGFNLEDPLTGEPDIRRAIAFAIDRDAIIRYILGGAARRAGALLPPEHWAGSSDLDGYPYDPERARELLRRAGYVRERPLHLVYKTSSDPVRVRLATALQHQLARVGVEVRLQSYDWGTFYGDIKAGRFQMYSLAWVGIKTPDIFRYAFHSASLPPSGANRGRFRDPVTDRLIEQAGAGEGIEEQAPLYRQLQRRLLDRLPVIPLWYEDHVLVTRRDIDGYALAGDGNYDGLAAIRRAPPSGGVPDVASH
jgi:peptide/nickel transport system substrate-binding protein